MTVGLFITILLIVMPVVFIVASFVTHAPARRVVAALAAGLVAAFIGAGLDAVGYSLGLWHYVTASPAHAPWPVYVAAGFLQGALALIGWRIRMRFTSFALVVFVALAAVGLTAQDYLAAALGPKVQVFAPGLAPAAGDFVVWSIVTTISLLLMSALAGTAQTREARFA
jgi:hypothetical protein